MSVFFAFIILTHYTHVHVHCYFLFIVSVIFHIYFKDGFVYDCADSFLLLFTFIIPYRISGGIKQNYTDTMMFLQFLFATFTIVSFANGSFTRQLVGHPNDAPPIDESLNDEWAEYKRSFNKSYGYEGEEQYRYLS